MTEVFNFSDSASIDSARTTDLSPLVTISDMLSYQSLMANRGELPLPSGFPQLSDFGLTESTVSERDATVLAADTERNCPGGGSSGDGGRDCEDTWN